MTRRSSSVVRSFTPASVLLGAALVFAGCGGGDERSGAAGPGSGGGGNPDDPSGFAGDQGVEDPGGTPIEGDGETDFISDVSESTGRSGGKQSAA